MNVAAPAPELSESLQWLNCGPQTLAAQKGRIVALVFWQAGSAWCQNLMGDMQLLQRKHAESLTVIGIHTPKFEAERTQRLVQKAVNRLGLQFPVAFDNEFVTWQHYGIEAWPSVVLLDVHGRRARLIVGDMQRETIESTIQQLLDDAGPQHLHFASRAACVTPEPSLPLAFPSGIAVGTNHLYVSDSGHHRVLECTLEGRILRRFGTGTPGMVDGKGEEACFQNPRGLFLSRDTLYVADTGNHALRTVRLLDGSIDTLAGNGRQGLLDGNATGRADTLALNTPWSLTGSNDKLFIAMAGAQQIWQFDQSDRSLRVLSGTGRLGLVDGGALDSSFGQPSDIVLIDQTLYIADAAASAIRSLHLPSGQVYTMAGQGVYEFGEQDGGRSQSLLQYPCALAVDPRSPMLWIADSYNNRLRTLRIGGNDLRRQELLVRLNEPMAMAASGNALWIANTNMHEVLRVEPATNTVRHLPIGE